MKSTSDEVLSPAKWVERLNEKGIKISERTLRAKAREYGQFYAVGQTMILHPWHIDTIFQKEAHAQIEIETRQKAVAKK